MTESNTRLQEEIYDALSDALSVEVNESHSCGADAVRTLAAERDEARRQLSTAIKLLEKADVELLNLRDAMPDSIRHVPAYKALGAILHEEARAFLTTQKKGT